MDVRPQDDVNTEALALALDVLEPLELDVTREPGWEDVKRSTERLAPRNDIDGW